MRAHFVSSLSSRFRRVHMSFFSRFFMRALVFAMPRPQHVSSTVHASTTCFEYRTCFIASKLHRGWGIVRCCATQTTRKSNCRLGSLVSVQPVKGISGSIIHHFLNGNVKSLIQEKCRTAAGFNVISLLSVDPKCCEPRHLALFIDCACVGLPWKGLHKTQVA